MPASATLNATRSRLRPAARVRRLLAALLLWGVALQPLPAHARGGVLVVMAERSAAHEEVLAAMRTGLAGLLDRRLSLRALTAAEFAQSGIGGGERPLPGLIVTIGTGAASVVLPERLPVPVYCSFLPQASYEALLPEAGRRSEAMRISALYLDQPFSRQLRLLRQALPRQTRVGVVLGPESRRNETSLRRAAAATGHVLVVERIAEERQLIGALHRAMDEADVLLALPDPLVFNRHTAQSVLLTTYRLGKPVIGYSRAYVNAGALLTVYSTPAQIGRQLAEELPALLAAPGRMPAPHHPRYFSVEVNERVARSLGLELEREEALERRLADSGTEESP